MPYKNNYFYICNYFHTYYVAQKDLKNHFFATFGLYILKNLNI